MSLGLHVAPHHTERETGTPVFRDHGGDNRMIRSFTRCQTIWMFWIKHEVISAILQQWKFRD